MAHGSRIKDTLLVWTSGDVNSVVQFRAREGRFLPGSTETEDTRTGAGQVRTIVEDRQMNDGVQSLAWDGRNASGLAVPAGTYLVRITASGASGARCQAVGTVHLVR